MVDVISSLGFLWNIPVFYISFVLTPFCSNASELVASIAFASRKKIANTSMTYSQVHSVLSCLCCSNPFCFSALWSGKNPTFVCDVVILTTQVIMNNTMGLGVFFALVAFRGLTWTFTAETVNKNRKDFISLCVYMYFLSVCYFVFRTCHRYSGSVAHQL
jgi:hypothetical protein